jgi:hypothetical protein
MTWNEMNDNDMNDNDIKYTNYIYDMTISQIILVKYEWKEIIAIWHIYWMTPTLIIEMTNNKTVTELHPKAQ